MRTGTNIILFILGIRLVIDARNTPESDTLCKKIKFIIDISGSAFDVFF